MSLFASEVGPVGLREVNGSDSVHVLAVPVLSFFQLVNLIVLFISSLEFRVLALRIHRFHMINLSVMGLQEGEPVSDAEREAPGLGNTSVRAKDAIEVEGQYPIESNQLVEGEAGLEEGDDVVPVFGHEDAFLHAVDVRVLEFFVGLHPREVVDVEVGAGDGGDVGEHFSELETWVQVEEVPDHSENLWVIQVEEDLLQHGGVRDDNIGDEGTQHNGEVNGECLCSSIRKSREEAGHRDVAH
mmetsp:Transcript_24224/g.37330  ORF Transcript_24224/g.37330 Transcript_24224/m.37330 type:complete len:242 (-) Transcript_24224:1293-2018(-)